MSTAAPPPLRHKKPSIFLWLGGAILILLLLFLYQLFGPSPRIIVSPQTTYITGPLRPDGLPDYEQHLLAELRAGVTPDNNAAALIWPAIWPGELSPPEYAPIAAELGLDKIPSQKDALVPIHRLVTALVKDELAAEIRTAITANPSVENYEEELYAGGNTNPDIQVDKRTDRMLEQLARPWTAARFPKIASWVKQNQQPLDMLLEASHRTRCYFPSPSLLDDEPTSLSAMLLPGVQSAREVGRSLPVRAMWHAGENRPEEAWRDLEAAHRISRLVTQGPTIIDQLVGNSISGLACDATVTFLHETKLTPELAREIHTSLAALPPFNGAADSIDRFERLSFLSTVVGFSKSGLSPDQLEPIRKIDQFNVSNLVSIDWNIALQHGNELIDRFAEAARKPNRVAQLSGVAIVEGEVDRALRQLDPNSVLGAAYSRTARSEIIASALAGRFMPAARAAFDLQERANTMHELTRLAAALAVFRAEHGNYPAKLDELTPAILKSLPVDLYNAQPYIYRRTADGYILYSAGDNGQDDRGSNDAWQIFQGYFLNKLDEAAAAKITIPSGSDDMAIRVPRSPVQIHKPSASKDGE
jgi:hypothetical protein